MTFSKPVTGNGWNGKSPMVGPLRRFDPATQMTQTNSLPTDLKTAPIRNVLMPKYMVTNWRERLGEQDGHA